MYDVKPRLHFLFTWPLFVISLLTSVVLWRCHGARRAVSPTRQCNRRTVADNVTCGSSNSSGSQAEKEEEPLLQTCSVIGRWSFSNRCTEKSNLTVNDTVPEDKQFHTWVFVKIILTITTTTKIIILKNKFYLMTKDLQTSLISRR